MQQVGLLSLTAYICSEPVCFHAQWFLAKWGCPLTTAQCRSVEGRYYHRNNSAIYVFDAAPFCAAKVSGTQLIYSPWAPTASIPQCHQALFHLWLKVRIEAGTGYKAKIGFPVKNKSDILLIALPVWMGERKYVGMFVSVGYVSILSGGQVKVQLWWSCVNVWETWWQSWYMVTMTVWPARPSHLHPLQNRRA